MKMRDRQERDRYTVCGTRQTNSYKQALTVFKLGEGACGLSETGHVAERSGGLHCTKPLGGIAYSTLC